MVKKSDKRLKVVEQQVAKPKEAAEAQVTSALPEEEYLNKPTILLKTLLSLYGKDYKSSSYKDPEGITWQLTRIQLPDRGRVAFRYAGEGEDTLKDVIKTVSFALNKVYPLFDKQVGGQIEGAKELLRHSGFSKRKKIIGSGGFGKLAKEIESYHTKSLREHNEKLLAAGRVMVEFEDIPFTAHTSQLTRGCKVKREKREYKLRGTGALVNTVESGGRVAFTPHPIIMLAAYGQTLDAARDTTKDVRISRILQQDFFTSLRPTSLERWQLQGPTETFENIIDSEANKLKRGCTTRCIAISRFRSLYATDSEREFRRRVKKNIKIVEEKNGGEFWFTDAKNKRGKRSKNEFMKYLLVDYKTYKPYIRKIELQNLSRPKSGG